MMSCHRGANSHLLREAHEFVWGLGRLCHVSAERLHNIKAGARLCVYGAENL
jgi:hypothetical protein